MNLEKTIKEFGLLNNCKKLGIAVSGGKDSMALLYWFINNYEKIGLTGICCINIEHGIRGEDSVADSEFVKQYCEKNGVECLTFAVNIPASAKEAKQTVEECARNERINIYRTLIDEKTVDKIAVGHHEQDQAETVLMHLFRGCGFNGLVGMPIERDGIIRPMLFTPKKEIDGYVCEHGIEHITDESNFCNNYSRNFIRNVIMPKIMQVFPSAIKSIARFSVLGIEENNFLNTLAEECIVIQNNGIYIDLTKARDKTVLSRAIFSALDKLGCSNDVFKVHIDSILALAVNSAGKRIDLPGGTVVIKEYDRIAFLKNFKNSVSCETVKFAVGEMTLDGVKIAAKLVDKIDFDNGAYGKRNLFIAINKIPQGTVLRFRNEGDVFKKFKGGTKKLSDYFTDMKISIIDRNRVPVLAKGGEVLAVLGYEISDLVKVCEGDEPVSIRIIQQV